MRRLAAALGAATVATLVLATGTALAGSGGSTGIAPLQPTLERRRRSTRARRSATCEMIAPGGTAAALQRARKDRPLPGGAGRKHPAPARWGPSERPLAERDAVAAVHVRGPEKRGQLQHLRDPRQPAGSERRRRAAPLHRHRSTWRSPSTRRRERCCTGRRTSARSGKASAFRTAQTHSGDEIVVYDEISNRWILTQFTTARPARCSGTASPSRRPAIRSGRTTATRSRRATFFPDYPKYGVMPNALYITTREFGPTVEYRIGVYAIDRHSSDRGRSEPDRRLVLPRRRHRSPLPPG